MIMSGQMLLAWLGRKHREPTACAAAGRIEAAVKQVIAQGKRLTRDLGGNASTTEMGDAVAAAVERMVARVERSRLRQGFGGLTHISPSKL
jgi:3-isopropylmalate dehydrogenase